jgi:hypothetical protein
MTWAHPLGVPIADSGRNMGHNFLATELSMRPDAEFNVAASLSRQVTITAGAVAHSKGAWSLPFVAALSRDVGGLILRPAVSNVSGAIASRLTDIGVGAAGFEVPVVENLDTGHVFSSLEQIVVPRPFKAGDRIVFRSQATVVSSTQTMQLIGLLDTHPFGSDPGRATTHGAVTATSRLTALAAPGSLNVPGAWTPIVASTPAAYAALILMVSNSPTATLIASNCLVDWAVGNPQNIFAQHQQLATFTTEGSQGKRFWTLPQRIPAGASVWARLRRSAVVGIDAGFVGIEY